MLNSLRREFFLFIMLKNSPVAGSPEGGFLSRCFKAVICPSIAGIQKAVASFGVIKSVIFSVYGVGFYQNRFPVFVAVEFFSYKKDQITILFAGKG